MRLWADAVKDQMISRGYISEDPDIPGAEFPQIVAGMRRLKPDCNELSTAFTANNIASMQGIDKPVLELVKNCRKKFTKTIMTNNDVPPTRPCIAPAQVIVNPILLPLNALPPSGVLQHLCRTLAHLSKMLRRPILMGQPNTYLLPRRIPKGRTILNLQARPIPNLRKMYYPQAGPVTG